RILSNTRRFESGGPRLNSRNRGDGCQDRISSGYRQRREPSNPCHYHSVLNFRDDQIAAGIIHIEVVAKRSARVADAYARTGAVAFVDRQLRGDIVGHIKQSDAGGSQCVSRKKLASAAYGHLIRKLAR